MNEVRSGDLKALCGRMAIRIAALAAVIALLFAYHDILFSILLPFICAYLFAILVNPIIRMMQKIFGGTRKIWAIISTTVVVGIVCAFLALLIYFIYDQVRLFLRDWPDYISSFLISLQKTIDELAAKLGIRSGYEESLQSGIRLGLEKLTQWITAWEPPVLEGAGSVITVSANIVITAAVFVLSSFYFMNDLGRIRGWMDRVLPDEIKSGLKKIQTAAAMAIGGYFKAQLILSAAVALICFIVLLALGQPFAFLIAVLICIVDFIPIFGSGTILIPWAVVLLFTGTYTKAFALLILSGVLFLLRKLAEPRVLGGQTGLSPLLSLICIYVGMRLGGVLGMILAPVFCMMGIELYRLGMFDGLFDDFRDISNKLSEILNS